MSNSIGLMLEELDNYVVTASEPELGRYFLESIMGQRLAIFCKEDSFELRVEAIIPFYSEYLNLTTYSRLVYLAYQFSHAATWPQPYRNELTQVRISATHRLTEDLTILERMLDRTVSCIDKIVSYLEVLADACDLNNVDLSMFESIDLNSIDVVALCEQKEARHGTWGKFIDHVKNFESDDDEINDEIRQMMVGWLTACQSFEEKNPTLCLGEVIRHVIHDVTDYRSQQVDPEDVQ